MYCRQRQVAYANVQTGTVVKDGAPRQEYSVHCTNIWVMSRTTNRPMV